MAKNIELLGKLLAALGVVACVVAGVARIAGSYHLGGLETMTIFNVGVGLMVTAIALKLYI